MPFPELTDPKDRNGVVVAVEDLIIVARFMDDEIDDDQIRRLMGATDIVVRTVDLALDMIGEAQNHVSVQQVLAFIAVLMQMRDNIDSVNELDS